jgi:hypothetical protein
MREQVAQAAAVNPGSTPGTMQEMVPFAFYRRAGNDLVGVLAFGHTFAKLAVIQRIVQPCCDRASIKILIPFRNTSTAKPSCSLSPRPRSG